MRLVLVGAGVILGALAEPAWAEDIYRWTDAGGRVHYSNMPSADDESTRVISGPPGPAAETPAGDDSSRSAGSDADTFSTDVSLRRRALEEDFRTTERRLREIDGELATLARARTRFAAGSDATGGVATAAADVRSDEETALETERKQLVEHVAKIQGDYGKLEAEVVTHYGSTPSWWVPLRGGR